MGLLGYLGYLSYLGYLTYLGLLPWLNGLRIQQGRQMKNSDAFRAKKQVLLAGQSVLLRNDRNRSFILLDSHFNKTGCPVLLKNKNRAIRAEFFSFNSWNLC